MTRQSNRGFSVVELMVAMALSLILLAGVLSVLYSSRITYRENERTARLQEYARAGIDMIVKDMRAGGYLGCNYTDTGSFRYSSNLVGDTDGADPAAATSLMWNFAVPIQGYNGEGGGAFDPALNTAPLTAGGLPEPDDESDVIAIRGVRLGVPQFPLTSAPMGGSSTVSVSKETDEVITSRSTMVVSNCNWSAVVALSGVDNGGAGNATSTVYFNTTAGTAMQPRNKTTRPDLPIALSLPAFMTPIDTIVYYVADSTDGTGPALWRRIGQRPAEEVIEGVENLQIEFGEDTNDDLMADRYVESPDVADWTNIVAAKIAVLIRTPEETGTETDEQEYDLLGETIDPPDDRRQRIVFTTTANLRNRMN